VTASPSAPPVRPIRAGAGRLSGREWRNLAGMGGVVLGLHLFGWITLVAVVAPAHYAVGHQVFGIGLGVTAYSLGMRHAFDADHIAAIDNTTRKLMSDGRRPLSVGFWFSLGHSSVVMALCVLLAAGVRSLAGQVEQESSPLQQATGLVGTAVSGTFLLLIGLINLGVMRRLVGVWRGMRAGIYDEAELEKHLDERGLLNRVLGRFTRAVRKPWHMYPVGLLFGLGFDTATEVSLLVLAGGAAAFALPWYALLTLPVLFAAGMSLLDTIDGSFMNFAYGWAFSKPVRKVYYNLTVTGLSVAVALVIGGIELISILVDKLHITSGPLAVIGSLDLNLVGYVVVVLFALTWLVAGLVWRFGRIEQRWGGPAEGGASAG
jgi:nickel/cobalt transporter (NiCoT) family protein